MPRSLVQRDQLLRRRVPRLLRPQTVLDQLRQLRVARARPQRLAQIDLPFVQQAPAEVPVSGKPDPVAGGAERLGHAGDDADPSAEGAAVLLARPVDARRLLEADGLQRELLFEPGADRLRRKHPEPLAPVISLEWHILDVSNFDRLVQREAGARAPK